MENTFHVWLAEAIEERGWSNTEFARRASVSNALVSMVLSGQRPPSTDFCVSTARALHVSADYVLGLAEFLPPSPEEVTSGNKLLARAWELLTSIPERALPYAIGMLRGLVEAPDRGQDSLPLADEGALDHENHLPRTPADREAYEFVQELNELPLDDQEKVFSFMKFLRDATSRGAKEGDSVPVDTDT